MFARVPRSAHHPGKRRLVHRMPARPHTHQDNAETESQLFPSVEGPTLATEAALATTTKTAFTVWINGATVGILQCLVTAQSLYGHGPIYQGCTLVCVRVHTHVCTHVYTQAAAKPAKAKKNPCAGLTPAAAAKCAVKMKEVVAILKGPRMSVHMPICMSICMSMHMCTHLSVHMPIHKCICQEAAALKSAKAHAAAALKKKAAEAANKAELVFFSTDLSGAHRR